MIDRSGWTDEQVNEAIFKAKGWVKVDYYGVIAWSQCPERYPKPRGTENEFDGIVDTVITSIPDYTHDWRLAGELLEEMGVAIKDGWEYSCEHSDFDGLDKMKWRVWMSRFTNDPRDFLSVSAESDSFLRSNAECYLNWLLAWKEQG